VFLQEFEETQLGDKQWGYDVQIIDQDATVGEYIKALDDFQARVMADCFGCDGCCHERVPLTCADYFLANPQRDKTLAEWLAETAELNFFGEAIDLTLRRTESGACHLLDEERKCCALHQYRTLTCRSHCCLPKSERAFNLRAAIINAGEDELVRQLLSAKEQPWSERLSGCNIEDYAENEFSRLPGDRWQDVILKNLVDPKLWQELTDE
jgi:Fe-S-cluster containining protein